MSFLAQVRMAQSKVRVSPRVNPNLQRHRRGHVRVFSCSGFSCFLVFVELPRCIVVWVPGITFELVCTSCVHNLCASGLQGVFIIYFRNMSRFLLYKYYVLLQVRLLNEKRNEGSISLGLEKSRDLQRKLILWGSYCEIKGRVWLAIEQRNKAIHGRYKRGEKNSDARFVHSCEIEILRLVDWVGGGYKG